MSEKQVPAMADKMWRRSLEQRFGRPADGVHHVQVGDNPTIYVFFFKDFPRPGLTTAVTCGLARANHPEWKAGRPELVVTMRSELPDWGLAAAYLASAFYGQKRFAYGDVFRIDVPIADDTNMKAFVVFAPDFLRPEHARFDAGAGKPIVLVSLYPLYEEELALYERIGVQKFWQLEGFELDNPAREPLKATA
jgi:hypothetical protein